MTSTFQRVGIILMISGVLAWAANSVHPKKIPWVQDWSRQVESKAQQRNIKLIPLSVAMEIFGVGDSIFIDARSSDDFSQGHVAGALSIPLASLEESFSTIAGLIDSGKELVVYCSNRECDDSLLLATELQSMGCRNLVLYIDGFEEWKKHGGEVGP